MVQLAKISNYATAKLS